MLKKDSFVLLWAVVLWALQNLMGILEVNSIVCEKRWLYQEHIGRLLDMYKRATCETASIDAVKNAYRHFVSICTALIRTKTRNSRVLTHLVTPCWKTRTMICRS
jgi:hypothetical protein